MVIKKNVIKNQKIKIKIYIKNHYRLIAVDLSRKEEIDADPKAIQQIVFVGQSKNWNNEIAVNEFMFVLTILEKWKKQD